MSTAVLLHAELRRLSTVLASTGGRDKLMRFVDYGTRAISYYMTNYLPEHPETKTASQLSSHLIKSRKLFRLGKSVEFLIAFLKVLTSSKDPLTIALTFGKSLGYGMWLFYDNLVYLSSLGLISSTSKAMRDKRSAKFWLFGILCGILINVRNIVQNKLLQKKTPNTEYLQLIRNCMDLATPAFKLDLRLARAIVPNKGAVGAIGTISSMISIYLLYPPLQIKQ